MLRGEVVCGWNCGAVAGRSCRQLSLFSSSCFPPSRSQAIKAEIQGTAVKPPQCRCAHMELKFWGQASQWTNCCASHPLIKPVSPTTFGTTPPPAK